MAKGKGIVKAIVVGLVLAVVGVGVSHVVHHWDKVEETYQKVEDFFTGNKGEQTPTPDQGENPEPGEGTTPDEGGEQTPDEGGNDAQLTYEVTITIDGQTSTQTVATGGLVTFPEEPTKEGFNFMGYAVEGSEELIDPETFIVTSNVTLIAVFEEIQLEITFETEETSNNQTIEYGEKITPPEAVEKEGYTFEGWAVKGTTEIVDFNTYVITENVIFEPIYKVKTYVVTITIDGQTTTQTVEHGENVIFPSAPTKDGYIFKGYVVEGSEEIINQSTFTVTSDVNFVAVFEDDVGTETPTIPDDGDGEWNPDEDLGDEPPIGL